MRKTLTLAIVGLSLLGVAGCRNDAPKESQSSHSAQTSSSTHSSESSSKKADKHALLPAGIQVDLAAAWDKFEKAYPDAKVTSIELEPEDGGDYYYEMEGANADMEVQLMVNAKTGAVKAKKEEALDEEDIGGAKRDQKGFDRANVLGLDKVTATAKKAAGDGDAYKWELEHEDGRAVWEIKFKTDTGDKVKVAVDAQSGQVVASD